MFRDDLDERAFNSGRNQKVIHSNRQPKQAVQAHIASSRIEIDEINLQNNGSNELNLSSTPNEVEKLKERILYLEQDQMAKQYQQEERDEKLKHSQIVLNQDQTTIKQQLTYLTQQLDDKDK
tara:strand:+ start:230 stop:595 length:366 start_codon:yes stop_codon:yes gene_type:complete